MLLIEIAGIIEVAVLASHPHNRWSRTMNDHYSTQVPAKMLTEVIQNAIDDIMRIAGSNAQGYHIVQTLMPVLQLAEQRLDYLLASGRPTCGW